MECSGFFLQIFQISDTVAGDWRSGFRRCLKFLIEYQSKTEFSSERERGSEGVGERRGREKMKKNSYLL